MGFSEDAINKNAFGGTELAARSLAPLIPAELLDQVQIISSRPNLSVLDEKKIRILWLHDLPEDPASERLSDPQYRKQFHHIIFVSNWQYSRYQQALGIPYTVNSGVIEVGVAPGRVVEKPKTPIRIVYSSTPQRGLNILYPAFERLAQNDRDIHLDVFSSFKLYGWPDKDKSFEKLFDLCRNHPQITYHGFVPNETLRESLETAHIWALPSIWLETSCRAMVEAMTARLLCIHPNFGALSDTAGGMNLMYQGDQNLNLHMALFHNALEHGINLIQSQPSQVADHLSNVKRYVDGRFGLNTAATNWANLIKRLLVVWPTEESRKIPATAEPVFKYNG